MKYRFLRTAYWLLSTLRERLGYGAALAARACFWQWQFKQPSGTLASHHAVQYSGRKGQRERVLLLLNLTKDTLSPSSSTLLSSSPSPKETITISEMPFAGAICLPIVLSTLVPLKNKASIEALIVQFNPSKVRYFVKNRHAYTLKQVWDDASIDDAYERLFKPYAASRHGDGVSHLTRFEVAKMAQVTGALHLLYDHNDLVGCQIGKAITRGGKRYWRCIRAGYPAAIFLDLQRFGEVHNTNVFSSIAWAFDQGYDFFDIAITLARPFDGVLQWKRSYRGLLNFMGNYAYFHVKIPQKNVSAFFWHTPLFAKEKGLLVLHIGIPAATQDEAVIAYLGMMGFGGLATVHVHCEAAPSAKIMTYLIKLFRHYDTQPSINICVHD